ncbi:MAG TPA: DUF748 domain-containing protein [Rhodocyclaceae bacterium]
MATRSRYRLLKIALAVLLLLGIAAAAGLHFGLQALQQKIETALGPESSVAEIKIGWGSVDIAGLRLKAPAGWPAADTLRAQHILVSPDMSSLFGGLSGSGEIRVGQIRVVGAYLSALRTADGKLRLLPSLLEKKASGGAAPPLAIGAVVLEDASLELFDASVRKPPLKIAVTDLQAHLGPLHLPDLKGRGKLELSGRIKGQRNDGEMTIRGDLEPATLESEITTKLRGVDLVAFQPYLLKAANSGVKQGRLDLDVTSTIHQRRLHAPGVLTLHGLELDDSGGFMGYARRAAVSLAKDSQQRIAVKFSLDGNLDDPKFQLNENIATRFAAGVGESLGLSVESVARSVGSIGQKSAEAVGGALRGLFGGK